MISQLEVRVICFKKKNIFGYLDSGKIASGKIISAIRVAQIGKLPGIAMQGVQVAASRKASSKYWYHHDLMSQTRFRFATIISQKCLTCSVGKIIIHRLRAKALAVQTSNSCYNHLEILTRASSP